MQQHHSSDVSAALGQMVARIDAHIEFSVRYQGQNQHYVARDSRSGKFYRFGAAEYHVASLLDGKRPLAVVQEELLALGLDWSIADVARFTAQLSKHGLAEIISAGPNGPAGHPIQPSSLMAGDASASGRKIPAADSGGSETMPNPEKPQQTSGSVNESPASKRSPGLQTLFFALSRLLSQRIPLLDGDLIASKLMPLVGWMFSTAAMVLWFSLVVAGVSAVWGQWDLFQVEIRRVFDQQLWLVVGLIWCVLKFVHECGHAVCAKRHGVKIGRMGVMFFLFAPIAYVDVTDAWRLRRRRDRIQIALAGVYLELAIGAVAALFWKYGGGGFAGHLAAQVFLIAGPATLLVNANPLLRLDGYYVLSDLLEIPNLREQGRRRLVAIVELVFFQLPLPETHLSPPWRRDVAVVHAALSVAFQIVWMSGLVFAVATWAKGLGIILAVIAGLMWGAIPLVRWMHKIWMIEPREGWVLNVYQRRLLALSVFVSLAIQFAAVHTSPLSRRIPVVVRFQDEQIARAPTDAFVRSVFVECGDRVDVGTLLMELYQGDLAVDRGQLVDRRDLAKLRSVQLRRRGEIAMALAMTDKVASLNRQIEELDDQLQAMQVVAKRPGRVTTRNLDHLMGAFVRKGEELVRIADPQEKELLVVVAEENLEAYNRAASRRVPAEIRLRGGEKIQSLLRQLQPSASRGLPHPALAATAGGPLAVQTLAKGESHQLVEPQLQSVLPLGPLDSLSVQSGQTGRLTVPDDRTLLSRLRERYWQR